MFKKVIGKNFVPKLKEYKQSFEAFKKPILIRFQKSSKDCLIRTLEGYVFCNKNDIIITGIMNEQYPLPAKEFLKNYKIINHYQASKRLKVVNCLEMHNKFKVKVSWGESVLKGEKGDYLIEYNKNDFGIVQKNIFEKTYEKCKK